MMNERIKEIALIASEQAMKSLRALNGGDQAKQLQTYSDAYNAKFAELIVQECIGKIETYRIPCGNSPAGEMASKWTYDALLDIIDDIEDHFGIE